MHHDIHCYQLGFHCLQMEDSLSIAVCKYLSKKRLSQLTEMFLLYTIIIIVRQVDVENGFVS